MSELAHRLKSTTASLGAHRLAACLQELQTVVDEQRLSCVDDLLDRLDVEFSDAVRAFQEIRRRPQ